MSQCPYEPRIGNTPHQGSIYRDIKVLAATGIPNEESIEFVEWSLPYAVVLSQECDLSLDQELRTDLKTQGAQSGDNDPDIKHDKLLLGILISPAYQAGSFRQGRHLDGLQRQMTAYNSRDFDQIKKNQNHRYHYLAGWKPYQIPELIIDFKHFFTIPVEQVLEQYGTEEHYVASLRSPYREEFSQRCAAYLTRIGVPIPHHRIEQPI